MKARGGVRVGLVVVASLSTLVAAVGAANAADPPPLTATPVTAASRATGTKAPTSRLAETDPALVGRTDATLVPVLVKLDYDSIATYGGGVSGLAATSPTATGAELTGTSPAEQQYEGYLARQEDAFVGALAQRVPEAEVGQRLRTVYGGLALTVPANRVGEVLAIDGVVAVQQDELRQPLTDSSPDFIGAPTLYRQLGGDRKKAGAGVIVGVLDTGAWPEHPSFADQGNLGAAPPTNDGQPRACDFGDNPLTPQADVFVCNHKLIGGRTMLSRSVNAGEVYPTARDSEGHGTHTASTAAGNALPSAPVLGVERGPVQGIAPGAWVSVYKVCAANGCPSSASVAAVQRAIGDGVDVINFSISGGTQPFSDPVELAFLDAYAAGVFVSASAGNEGPGASTANHLSPWVTTVAASTQTREFVSTLTVRGSDGATATFAGASITAGAGPAPVVLSSAAPYSNELCDKPAAPGTFTGKIVACARGVVARVDKGYNVAHGGAVGMILYNRTLADVETDNHWLPTVHLADGRPFLAFYAAHPGITATFTAGQRAAGQGDVMAAFSSRGPGGNFVKPDVTAPGVEILAGHTPTPESTTGGPPGQYFQAIAGTSMSAPHVAGSGALLKALHPDWTPGQVKSALMTTAVTSVVKEDLVTPADPFDYGAGRIDLTRAGNPGLTFDESAERMAELGNDPVNAVQLNLPSVNAPVLPGRITTVRTATNVSGARAHYKIQVTDPQNTTISVRPDRFTLAPGESVELSITVDTTASAGQYFGQIRLEPSRKGLPTLHLPVAFSPQQGSVSLTSSCQPSAVVVKGLSTCTVGAQNNSFNATTVDLVTTVDRPLSIAKVTGAYWTGARRAELRNVALAGAVPGTPSIGPGELFGYVPLDAFGVTPEPIGDEDIINYDVPAFVYAGKTYTSIGVDSNGYAVVGGGTAEDNNCCDPKIPDPARPNNVLAPFWTDLDGTGAEGLRVGTLTDGTDGWLVVEWQVNVFGTTSNRHFQVWIGLNGTEDITYAYDPEALPAAPEDPEQAWVVGAENENGSGGDTIDGLPLGDLRVVSTDPTPGAKVGYTVVVKGERPGVGHVTTELESPDVPGTTVVTSPVLVNRAPGRRGS